MTVLGCDELVALDAIDVVDLGGSETQIITALEGVPLDLVVVSGNPAVIDGVDLSLVLEVQSTSPAVLEGESPLDALIVSAGTPGAPGPAGSGVELLAMAAENISALHVVLVAPDGTATLASSDQVADGQAVVGVSKTAALVGEEFAIALMGEVSGNLLPVGPLYLGVGGILTDDPDSGIYQLRVGYALAADRLLIRFETPIYHAP